MAQVARPARIVGMDERNRSAFALLAAMQLDFFTPLADGPMRAEEVAGALNVDAEKLSQLLYVFVVDGLLTVADGRFANTGETDQFLVHGKPQGLCVLASEALRRGSRLIFLTPNPLPSEGRGSNAAPR